MSRVTGSRVRSQLVASVLRLLPPREGIHYYAAIGSIIMSSADLLAVPSPATVGCRKRLVQCAVAHRNQGHSGPCGESLNIRNHGLSFRSLLYTLHPGKVAPSVLRFGINFAGSCWGFNAVKFELGAARLMMRSLPRREFPDVDMDMSAGV